MEGEKVGCLDSELMVIPIAIVVTVVMLPAACVLVVVVPLVGAGVCLYNAGSYIKRKVEKRLARSSGLPLLSEEEAEEIVPGIVGKR